MSIDGVLSSDASVVRWAESIGAQFRCHDGDTADWVRGLEPDYLLSIFNLVILPPAVIEAPRIAAINYHDALLPRYAGLHATSWALINGEREHGITWHLMESGIDTGAILRQQPIKVESTDTALSLNLKCSAAVVKSLEALIPDLVAGSLRAEPQDLRTRTYYAGSRRPACGGVLNWNQTAGDIDALIRACDFGTYRNPLGMPKILVGDDSMIATQSTLSVRPAESPAGVLVHIGEDALTVSTASGPLDVSGLMTIDGEPLSGSDAARRYGLEVGQQLPVVTGNDLDGLTAVSEKLARHENYWERRLESLVPAAPLRSSRDVTSAPRDSPVRLSWRIPQAVAEWVARHESRWQPEEFLVAACGAFLGRLAVSESFDVELMRGNAIGYPALFAASVPFRFELSTDFGEVLAHVHAELELIDRRQTYPRDLVRRSPRLRDQPHLRREAKLPVGVVLGDAPGKLPHWELAIGVPNQAGHGFIDVDRSLHDQLPGLAERLTRFVEQVADTDGAFGTVALADAEEHDRLLEWGTGPAAPTSKALLHELVESQARSTPDAVAVCCGATELTYGELNSSANALAAVLRRDGVGPEIGVGIYVERSPALVIGLLGILKAGGFYVPLDPTLPRKRLEFLIEDAQLRTIVTVTAQEGRFPSTTLVYLDDLDTDADAPGMPAGEARANAHGDELSAAYVLYTSGSTGEPKGVQVEHRSVVNFVQAATAEYRLTPADRLLQFASIGFDTSIEEIFPTLVSGATLVLRPDDMLGSAKSFLDACAEFRISVLDLPTAYWHTLVTQLQRGAASLWPELRMVIIGGEAADVCAVDDYFTVTDGSVELINTYGPTEATVVSTLVKLTASESGCARVPIGVPLPGVSVQVLDRFGLPVPAGIPGELHIGGAGVARGYLHRPELTRGAFVFRSDSSGILTRFFRTGDLCNWRTNGMLEFVGRIDDQVKVRGHRVELREIELALEAQPTIACAAVVARDRHAGNDAGTVLRACVVPRVAGGVEIAQLRATLRDQLPAWMIPGEWVVLDHMPISTNGKLDRRALASETSAGLRSSTPARYGPDDEPATLLEQEIVDIWCELFRLDHIRRDDDFFDLGGHSLLAVRFVEELERRLGHSLPITALFEHPTVESLTRVLADQNWIPAWTSLVPLKPSGTRQPLFMVHGLGAEVFGYRSFANQLDTNQPVYGVQAAANPDGSLRHSDLNEMADHYVSEIRSCQPAGPYYVGGFSLGGWYAYEVASRLRAAGEHVCLIVVDTYPYCSTPWPARGAYVVLKIVRATVRVPIHVGKVLELGVSGAIPYLADKTRTLIRNLSRPALDHGLPPAQSPILGEGVTAAPEDNYFVAVAARHSVRAIDCRVELLLSDTPKMSERAIQAMKFVFWRLLVRGELRVHRIRASHVGMLGDEQVASTVNQILTSANAAGRSRARGERSRSSGEIGVRR